MTVRVVLLRDFPRLSYAITVIADNDGASQLSPDEQVIPPEFLERFQEGERQLADFTDEQLDEFAAGEQDSPEVLAMIERAPEAHDILDEAFDGAFTQFVLDI